MQNLSVKSFNKKSDVKPFRHHFYKLCQKHKGPLHSVFIGQINTRSLFKSIVYRILGYDYNLLTASLSKARGGRSQDNGDMPRAAFVFTLGTVSRKKVAVLLDFVQITKNYQIIDYQKIIGIL